MSESEMDDMSQQTSRAARRAGEAVAQIVAAAKVAHPKRTRLSRQDRKAAQAAVSRILREERERERQEAAQLRQHLSERIHAHRTAVWAGSDVRADDSMREWFGRQQALTVGRVDLEQQIVGAPGLSRTERGQALTALRTAHYLPSQQLPKRIFAPTSGIGAVRARVEAALGRLRAGVARPEERPRLARWDAVQLARHGGTQAERQQAVQQQVTAPTVGPARQPVPMAAVRDAQPQAPGRYTPDQARAVQAIRMAQAQWRMEAATAATERREWLALQRRATAQEAERVGLTVGQVRWEIDNSEANSQVETVIQYQTPDAPATVQRIRALHGTDRESAAWAAAQLRDEQSWAPGTRFRTGVYHPDHKEAVYTTAGNRSQVAAALAGRRKGLEEQAQAQPTPREAAPWTTLVRYHAPDSAPWDALSMLKQGHNDRAAAAAWTQRTVDELVIEPGTTVSASLWRRDEIEPDFIARGVPSEVVQEIGRRWIASPRETSTPRPVTVERAARNGHTVHEAVPSSSAQGDSRTEAVQEFDALVARNMAEAMPADAPEHAWSRLTDVHWHTMTHGDDNVDEMARWWASEGAQAYWADKNPEATGNGHRPSAESHEVRRLREEIARIKGQRDAAVQKLAAATPPEQRYGSPERQAEAAKQAAREQSAASAPQPAKPSPASTGPQVQAEEDYHQAVMSNPPEPEEEPVFELVED